MEDGGDVVVDLEREISQSFAAVGKRLSLKPQELLRTLEGSSVVVHMDLRRLYTLLMVFLSSYLGYTSKGTPSFVNYCRTNIIFFAGLMNVWWKRFTISRKR